MPHKAFLKKKSLLDRFKDDYGGHTGYIQSARAEHTWSNPLTRRKRTNKLNSWIKSFAGKRHVHKLARFNAQQAGRNESYEDVKLDCLRYADILELPNGVCVKVNATIRCPRRAAFVFRITGIYDAEPENPSKYVIRGFYPVYGLERKPSEEFDIPCNDVSDIEQWVKSNEKGNRMQNEAMSLKGFIENLTEKLTKQFDLDEDEVKNYLDSHTEEMQILLDNKDMSLKEKVLFVRSEITGEKDESKKSESVPESDYIQEFRSWLDAQEGEQYNEQEITDFGWEWKSQDVGYPNGNKTYYDYFTMEDDGVTYRLEVAWNSFNETIVGNKIWQDSSEAKKSEGFSLELIDTIKVPQWLWNAYNFNDTTDLEDDEIKKLDAFKEEYKFNHLDDRGEEAYFSSHNDFDSLGGNVYDVDVYKRSDMPTEKKNESIKDFPTNTGYKFTFGFQNPKTANVAMNVAKEKGYACEQGRGTGFDDYSNVSIWVKEPQDAIRFADAIVNVANGENGVSLERSDVDKAFALAVKNNAGYKENKDAIDTAASQYALSIRPTESFDGLFILGELTDVVDFLEEIK